MGKYEFNISTDDIDGDDVYYYIDWDDGTNSNWIGPYSTDEEIIVEHQWKVWPTIFNIQVKAKDIHNHESQWSYKHHISIYTLAFLCGSIVEKSSSDDLINIKARKVLWLSIRPFKLFIIQQMPHNPDFYIYVKDKYIGFLGKSFVFGTFIARRN